MNRLIACAFALLAVAASAEEKPLPSWTFDRDAQGWATIPGTVTRTVWEDGSLRWDYDRDAKGQTFGVSVGGLSLPDRPSVYLKLRVKAEGTDFLLVAAKTGAGAVFCTKFPVAKGAWQDVWVSTEVFIPGEQAVKPAEIRELLLWDGDDGVAKGHVTFRLDALSVATDPPKPAAVAMPAPVAPHPKLSVCLSFRALNDPKQAAVELDEAKKLGISLVELANGEWTDYEVAPGKWDWSKLDALVKEVAARDLKLVACMGGILNIKYDWKVHTPSDVAFSGDFTALLPRYRAYLDRFFERYGRHIRFFTFHSEACGKYFAQHPAELDSYEKFLREAATHVAKIAPGVKTGVCLQSEERPEVLKRLSRVGDVTTILYDPPRTPDHAAEEIASFLELAGDRPFAFNEVFTQGSPLAGRGEEAQAAFVRELFAALAKHEKRLAWCTWWCLRDDDPAIWDYLGEYLAGGKGPAATSFRALATCGLLRGDGTAKPATAEWAKGAAALPR
ncbi:MAG: hypothetical protein IT452_19395 [Planctomycetia bacterium]|nr:hypothetical protein [Planctomycetia bacterium]